MDRPGGPRGLEPGGSCTLASHTLRLGSNEGSTAEEVVQGGLRDPGCGGPTV